MEVFKIINPRYLVLKWLIGIRARASIWEISNAVTDGKKLLLGAVRLSVSEIL